MSIGDRDVAALRLVTRELVASVASIQPEQWAAATPCDDWDLSALLDHITGGNWLTIGVLAGEKADDAMTATMARFDEGSPTRDQAIAALEDQLSAFLQPRVLDRRWSHVTGDRRGRDILRLRLHDLIVHSWDVDETIRPGAGLPDALLRWGLDELAHHDSLAAELFGLEDGPGIRQRDGATAYLEAFGRRPGRSRA